MMKFRILFLFAAILILSSCSGGEVKRSLGIDKRSPDEFMVISRPPLSVPPDFSLRAPGGPMENNNRNITEEAKTAVFNSKPESNDNIFKSGSRAAKTGADAKFLERAGANEGDSSIRRTLIEEENSYQVMEEEKGYFESMFDSMTNSEEPVVDAGKEKERLEKNDMEDLPPTEGETPTKKVKKSVF